MATVQKKELVLAKVDIAPWTMQSTELVRKTLQTPKA